MEHRVMKGVVVICALAAAISWFRIVTFDYETGVPRAIGGREGMMPVVVQLAVALYVMKRVRIPYVRTFFGTYAAFVCFRAVTFQLLDVSLQTKDYLSAAQFSLGAIVSAAYLLESKRE